MATGNHVAVRARGFAALAAIVLVVFPALGQSATTNGDHATRTPPGGSAFVVLLNGVAAATFSAANLPALRIPVPGVPRNGSSGIGVTLKRGIAHGHALSNWVEQAREQHGRASSSVTLVGYAPSGDVVVRYELQDAWPANYEGPNLNSQGNDVAIELLEIECERITIVSPSR
jgi:hypothetical protein